jgi:hypothetical protein
MKNIRNIHLLLGTFFGPAIIFFAFSGLLQVIGLHENKDKSGPPPAAWIAKLAELHKSQQFRPARPPGTAPHQRADLKTPSGQPGTNEKQEPESFVPLKLFVLLMGIGLIVTTVIGIVISLQNPRTRRTALISLALGTVLPLLLLAL